MATDDIKQAYRSPQTLLSELLAESPVLTESTGEGYDDQGGYNGEWD